MFKGYPSKGNIENLKGEFKHPPKGYGNVPFFWWNGDSLKCERLEEELDILKESATDGFSVSYHHLDSSVDPELHRNGFGLYGRTEPGVPAVFSDEWWHLWNWFAGACAKRGMGVGLDDYTVGWKGNGYYPDELDSLPIFKGYQGKLLFDSIQVKGGEEISYQVPERLISIVAYPTGEDLSSFVSDGILKWRAPKGSGCSIFTVSTSDSYVLHPEHGKELVKVYFDRFETHTDSLGQKGLNYFFQDELSYPLTIGSWSEDFDSIFKVRKGYDILPYLGALRYNMGEITPKIRMDYCEVLTDLAGERYFSPVFNWHASRGLIYGCDNLGRGLDPTAYVDYFNAISWFTAPGNDAPSTGSSFIQTKVSSSIAHLYDRPRTWLEAFHSMGWGSSGSWLRRQIDHHFMAGGNLVCMHGLYYSTHGGWWEWAPPCFHFRMPYWPHMKGWLSYTERMCYLMSQGQHVCDALILYPTEPCQVYKDWNCKGTFDLAFNLSCAGIDYDFADFRSLRDGGVSNGYLHIGKEDYRVIVLADMKAIHFSSLQKILEHYRSGGIVIATGALPCCSNTDKSDEVDAILKELFGVSSQDFIPGMCGKLQKNSANGAAIYLNGDAVTETISSLILRDFIPENGVGKVLHRRIGLRDVYMIADVEENALCFFRASGQVELWDGMTGETAPFAVERQNDEGTWIRVKGGVGNSYVFVFSPGSPLFNNDEEHLSHPVYEVFLGGDWETEFSPTLQNKWGDFRLPAFDGFIGPEARSFRNHAACVNDINWFTNDFNDSSWPESIWGYGPKLEYLNIDDTVSFEIATECVQKENKEWQLSEFSWQYGIWDEPGSQGQHGLKSRLSNGFMVLNGGCHQFFRTFVHVPSDGWYQFITDGVSPDFLTMDNCVVSDKRIFLSKGWHRLLMGYKNTPSIPYEMTKGGFHDFRKRSAVVLYPENAIIPEMPNAYDSKVSMRWNSPDRLVFDPSCGRDSIWWFRCSSVPGTTGMQFALYGKLKKVYVNGGGIEDKYIKFIGNNDEGVYFYEVSLPNHCLHEALIAFSVEVTKGFTGCSAIAEPIKFETGKGLMPTGNWGKRGSMRYYSGGLYYRKYFSLPQGVPLNKVVLDLGEVTASCEVRINGVLAGCLMSPPFSVDISHLLKEDKNFIEVLVYSTLSNHYQTIPTPYRGDGEAGLLGPVRLIFND